MGIVLAGIVVGVVGIIVAVLLGIASEAFKVEVDERVINVRAELPGNNCGGCGYAGCDAMAEAIAKGLAPANGCPVGGAATAEEIAKVYNAIKASNPDEKLVQLKSLEALEEVAKGEANKIFIPFEATQALSSLGAMSDVVKDKKDNK